jgi:hypothetical protein
LGGWDQVDCIYRNAQAKMIARPPSQKKKVGCNRVPVISAMAGSVK